MASNPPEHATLVDIHGARELPLVTVEGYSLQLRDKDGFIGDGASQTAFRELLQQARKDRPTEGPLCPHPESRWNAWASKTRARPSWTAGCTSRSPARR